MAVFETSEVAVMEVWLIDSPDPKANASWATTMILHLVFTCSMTFWNEWYRTKGLAVQNLQQDV